MVKLFTRPGAYGKGHRDILGCPWRRFVNGVGLYICQKKKGTKGKKERGKKRGGEEEDRQTDRLRDSASVI